MTLRGAFGGDVQRIQKQIDDLLAREDGLIVLFDGSRMVSYSQGFGVSPCQLELLTVEIERAIRNVVGGQPLTNRRNRRNREKAKPRNNRSAGAALFQHVGRFGRRVSVTRTGRQREEGSWFTQKHNRTSGRGTSNGEHEPAEAGSLQSSNVRHSWL